GAHGGRPAPAAASEKRPDTREVAMKPPPFAYAAPATLEEAVGLLAEHAEAEPRVLAGGQSLIPLMNFRLAKPGYLVDLRNVAGLSGIRRDGDVLVIGAMTRLAEVERSPEVAVAAPLVTEAVGLVAPAPVRNSGTVGGSLAHADPAAELPAVALALHAELVASGPGHGSRTGAGRRSRRRRSDPRRGGRGRDRPVASRRPARQPGDPARPGPDLPAARDRTGGRPRPEREVRTMASDTRTISLTVNGQPHVAQVEPRRLLVDFLREDLGLPGTHIGCEHGVCGTCTVLLHGASL